MKLKNVNLSFFILAVLLISSLGFFVVANENSQNQKNIFIDSDQDGLSDKEEVTYGTDPQNADSDGDGYNDGAEISAGYNPLKKAPGDKLSPEGYQNKIPYEMYSQEEEDNMTKQVSQKVYEILSDSERENITAEDINEIVNPLVEKEIEVPQISTEDIIIKKQNYSKLSSAKKAEKKKNDAINYSIAILYILTSNSPEPLTSSSDVSSAMEKILNKLTSAFESGDLTDLEDLSKSGESALEQLKKVEVPEDMVETQIKALQYAIYAKNLKSSIKQNPEDPIESLINYSKIQSLIESFIDFFDEIQEKFDKYGIEYEDIQSEIEKRGINLSL